MKNTVTYLSLALMSTMLMSFSGAPECEDNCEHLVISEIDYIEDSDDFELSFDTAPYLPEGFNAYKGMGADLTDITYIKDEREFELGFNTAEYLPVGFDAYEGMILNLNEIEYIEDEEEVELDFNVQKYLPENFDTTSR